MHPPQVTVEELQRILDATPFLRPYAFRVIEREAGRCALRVPFQESLERPGGIVSGMSIMGAADVAMWLAIMTLRGTQEVWVTSDMKTAFLRSGRQADVKCSASVLKSGKRVMYGTAECTGPNGELLAHHVLTYMRAD